MSLLLWHNCPAVFAAMGAKPEVAAPAVAYMRARCLASPAILAYYVMSGTFRGFKDTRWVGAGLGRWQRRPLLLLVQGAGPDCAVCACC